MTAAEIEKCMDDFGTDIYRFCLKLCLDKADAEDLYQQTFLKALEAEWTLDWENNPRALFFSLAHNLWKSARRKQARRNTIAPCSNFDEETEAVLHTQGSMEDDYLQKELNHKLKAALYQQEAALRKRSVTHQLSIWYLPMVLNLIMFSSLAFLAWIMIENRYLSYFAMGICIYAGVAGILLTVVGVKRADIKEKITIRVEKGVLA